MGLRSLLLVVLTVALAACAPGDSPFKPDRRAVDSNPLAGLASAAGVVVEPPMAATMTAMGGPLFTGDMAERFTVVMAAALQKEDVLAESAVKQVDLGFTLDSRVEVVDSDEHALRLAVEWALRNDAGKPSGFYRHEVTISRLAWEQGQDGPLLLIAQLAAPQIASLLDDSRDLGSGPTAAPSAPRSNAAAPPPMGTLPELSAQPTVRIGPVTGAPGDGNESLPLALAEMFGQAGFPVVMADADGAERADFAVTGRVEMHPGQAGREGIELNWTILDSTGNQLGTLRQTNAIPAGSLDGAWGPIAPAAASGAFQGTLDVLNQLGQ